MRVGVQTSDMVEKARMAYEERDQRTQKAQEQIEKLERIAKMLTNKQVNEAPALIDLEPNPETGVFENESIKDAEEFINAEELINAEQPQL
jgi:altronate dehydratase